MAAPNVTLKVKFRSSSVVDRKGPIIYVVIYRRVSRQFTTNMRIDPNEWDKSRECIIAASANVQRGDILSQYASRIKSDIMRLKRIVLNFTQRSEEFSVDDIITEFHRQLQNQSFFNYMDAVIARLVKLNKIGTANNYRHSLNSFKRFHNNEDIRFEEITTEMMEEYEAWLKKSDIKPNSSSFYMRNLRAVYNRAVEECIIIDIKPFRKVYTGVEKTVKRAITLPDIRKIKDLDLSNNPSVEFARDVFLFLFYGMGISFIDASFLKNDNIANGMLIYRRSKTSQRIDVPLCNHIYQLIDKYHKEDSEYVLPIILSTDKSERTQYESTLHRINILLKKVGDMVGLNIPLTTYVARHSWASIAKEMGVDISVISDALGHDNIRTTEIYLATISCSKLIAANEKVLEGLDAI